MLFGNKQNIFQLPAATDEVLKGNIPIVHELQTVTVTLVAGVGTVDLDSVVGKGLGEVYGILPLMTEADSKVLGVKVAAHSATAGKVTVTVRASASSTASITFKAYIVGVVYPVNQ